MEFLTLESAIEWMVYFGATPPTLRFLDGEVREYRPGYQDSDAAYRRYCHRSYMAGRLHQLITNAPNGAAFRWARQHPKTGRMVVDLSMAAEALDYLAEMAVYVRDEYNAAVMLGPSGLHMVKSRIVNYPDPRVKVFLPGVAARFSMVGIDLIRLLEIDGFNLPVDGSGRLKAANDEVQESAGVPLPSVSVPVDQRSESQEQRQERRHRMCVELCVEAGSKMPTDDYMRLPRGIKKLAEKEGITRQAFAEDVKAHIRRINSK